MPIKSGMKRNQKGVTIVEFALVFVPLLLLIFAVVEFGILFFVQHTVQFATREGVRLALTGRALNDAQGNPMSREASIIKVIGDNATVAVKPSDLQISIYPINADYSDPSGWQTTQNAGSPGSYMRVRTRYTHLLLTPLIATFFPGGKFAVEAQSTYRNELFQ